MRTSTLSILAFLLTLGATSAMAQDEAEAPRLQRTEFQRLRLGGDLGIAAGTTGYDFGMAVVGHLRAGLQNDDTWALYYQAGALIGGGASFTLFGSTGPRGLFLHTSSAVVEVTWGDLVQVGLGPTFAAGVQGIPGQGEVAVVGGGFTGRLAITFGGDGTGTRQGFSIGAQTDIVFLHPADTVWMGALTLGWETF